MSAAPNDHPFTPDLFERDDESDDAVFYCEARKVVHLDDGALAAVQRFYAESLPPRGRILDLMSSWRSHLGPELAAAHVVGLGMNADEMGENPELDEFVVHDLNREPELPFDGARFDAAVLTVSVQYLVHPIEVFRSVARCLVPGAPFIVVVSHRCFPTKAVRIWHRCKDMRERMELCMAYFSFAGGFTDVQGVDLRPLARGTDDPVRAVLGKREGAPAATTPRAGGWRRR